MLPPVFRSAEWNGTIYHFYRDKERTLNEWLTSAPEDARAIRKLFKRITALSPMQMPITDIKGVKKEKSAARASGMLKMLPALPTYNRLGKVSVSEYVAAFTNPGLQLVLSGVVPKESPASSLLLTLATITSGDGGYPQGGSLGLAERMRQTFVSLGGNLQLNTKVDKVSIRNNKVEGVEVEGEMIAADAVVVSAETVAALRNLFDTDVPAQEAWLQKLQGAAKPSNCTFIAVGLRVDLPEAPAFVLPKPIRYRNFEEVALGMHNYHGYPDHAPEGGTVLTTAFIDDSYDFWKEAQERGVYKEEKQKLADQVVEALESKWPAIRGQVEVVDVSTPLTYERYTSAYHGAWMTRHHPGDKIVQYPGEVASVPGLYFAGHRLMPPGGMPAALASGRTAAQLLCRQFDMTFK